jgi:hypothetical protein
LCCSLLQNNRLSIVCLKRTAICKLDFPCLGFWNEKRITNYYGVVLLSIPKPPATIECLRDDLERHPNNKHGVEGMRMRNRRYLVPGNAASCRVVLEGWYKVFHPAASLPSYRQLASSVETKTYQGLDDGVAVLFPEKRIQDLHGRPGLFSKVTLEHTMRSPSQKSRTIHGCADRAPPLLET